MLFFIILVLLLICFIAPSPLGSLILGVTCLLITLHEWLENRKYMK